MDAALKYKIVERIINIDDDIVLQEVQALLEMTNDDFGYTLSDEVKKSVEEACQEFDNGSEGIPHQEVMERTRKLFGLK